MNFKFLFKSVLLLMVATVVTAATDQCDEIRNYFKSRKLNDIVVGCKSSENGKVFQLEIENNKLKIKDINKVVSYKSIEYLNIHKLVVTRTIVDKIASITSLSGLEFEGCSFNSNLNFSALKNKLESFGIMKYSSIKEVPEFVYTLTNLKKLKLNGIGLSAFPKKVLNLKKLTILNLSSNKIKIIPDNISNLKKLEIFNLSNNMITSIPTSLGQLTNLIELELENNKISTIPKALGNLKKLTYLDLEDNNIKNKEVPKFLKNLPKLEHLYI